MPIYEYKCSDCSFKFEELVPLMTEDRNFTVCKNCGGRADRVPSVASFKLEGAGFHRNDYPNIDQAVGSDSEKRWTQYYERKEEREKAGVKSESSTHSLVYKDEDSGVSSLPISEAGLSDIKGIPRK